MESVFDALVIFVVQDILIFVTIVRVVFFCLVCWSMTYIDQGKETRQLQGVHDKVWRDSFECDDVHKSPRDRRGNALMRFIFAYFFEKESGGVHYCI